METKPEERSPKRQRADSVEEEAVEAETSEYTEEEIQRGKQLIEAVVAGDLASV